MRASDRAGDRERTLISQILSNESSVTEIEERENERERQTGRKRNTEKRRIEIKR